MLDIARLGDFLRRIGGRIRHQALNQVSPLAVPLLLEIGVERVAKSGEETLLREAAVALVAEVEAGPQIDLARDYGAIRAQTRTSRRRRV